MIKILLSLLFTTALPVQASKSSPQLTPQGSPRHPLNRFSPTHTGFNPDGSEMTRGLPPRPASAPKVRPAPVAVSSSPVVPLIALAAIAVPLLNLSANPTNPTQS